jgi:hypothetical protein
MYEFVGSERYYRDYQYAVTMINNNMYSTHRKHIKYRLSK